MEKENTKLTKLEIMDKDDYPEELKEQGAAALLLSCLPYTSDILGGGKRNRNSSSSRKCPRVFPTQNLGAAVRRNHFDDKQGEYNSNAAAAATNLPRKPPIRRSEETLKLIGNYEPHEVPSIPGLNGIIGKCSKPFEKQLTESDLRDDQSRLSINKADAQNVTTYDPNGKEFAMVFKIWVSKIHVLIGGWKAFFHEHRLRKDQDFVTLWMFRRLDTKKLCFVITWRSLPGVTTPIKRERVRMN
ncbi:B3 domain-containing protein [Salix suchowensis]|nr:B3 domain-containing protein [Salix suchowensis]